MMQQDTALYLGPATVSRTLGKRALVRRPESPLEQWADLALAFPYQPAPGDLVLVAAQEERTYVIGVLNGRGPTLLPFPGDLTLSAPDGRIRLQSGQGVSLEAPTIELSADKVELESRSFVQRLESAYLWVKDLVQVRAGRSRTVVDGALHQTAERTLIRSERETKIDGEQIQLG